MRYSESLGGNTVNGIADSTVCSLTSPTPEVNPSSLVSIVQLDESKTELACVLERRDLNQIFQRIDDRHTPKCVHNGHYCPLPNDRMIVQKSFGGRYHITYMSRFVSGTD